MRTNHLRFAILAGASLVSCADDPTTPTIDETFTDDGARIVRAIDGTLTGVSAAAAKDVVTAYLGTDAQLRIVDEQQQRGVTHIRMDQEIDGLRVHGGYVKAALGANGELLQVISRVAPAVSVGSASLQGSISERDALVAAFRHLGYSEASVAQTGSTGNTTRFSGNAIFLRDPSVERVAYIDGNGATRHGYIVETWTLKGNLLDETLVDSSGSIVSSERRTQNDSYNVFVEDPSKGAQTIIAGGIRTESPAGWLGTGAQTSTNIAGNNVHSYLDVDANNQPDAGGTAVGDGNFLTAANLAVQPSTAANRNVAVQNLFYLNNVVHDVLYRHGFNEVAGNFQTDNFGKTRRGGGDPVNAEAQDGSGTDNANFATPRDGSSPRMQMYLWNSAIPLFLVSAGGSSYGAYASAFGPQTANISGALAVYNDGTGAASDGCEASTTSLAGKVAIVDRGTCTFIIKVKNAQNAGATGVVIANNITGPAFSGGGEDATITIPSGMVTLEDGNALKAQAGAAATLGMNPAERIYLDGDVDADIVFHEYGHGLSWRMIGNMSGAMSGAIGEGASDTVAFLINGDDRIGEYSVTDARGIRTQPYASYVGSYATSVTGTEVHNDGELYAAIMYRILTSYQAAGLTNEDVLSDFVNGMNFTPSGPAYEHMRDGMLAAAPDTRDCMIWEAFAHYGVGVGAKGTTKGKFSVTESFVLPATCQ